MLFPSLGSLHLNSTWVLATTSLWRIRTSSLPSLTLMAKATLAQIACSPNNSNRQWCMLKAKCSRIKSSNHPAINNSLNSIVLTKNKRSTASKIRPPTLWNQIMPRNSTLKAKVKAKDSNASAILIFQGAQISMQLHLPLLFPTLTSKTFLSYHRLTNKFSPILVSLTSKGKLATRLIWLLPDQPKMERSPATPVRFRKWIRAIS